MRNYLLTLSWVKGGFNSDMVISSQAGSKTEKSVCMQHFMKQSLWQQWMILLHRDNDIKPMHCTLSALFLSYARHWREQFSCARHTHNASLFHVGLCFIQKKLFLCVFARLYSRRVWLNLGSFVPLCSFLALLYVLNKYMQKIILYLCFAEVYSKLLV